MNCVSISLEWSSTNTTSRVPVVKPSEGVDRFECGVQLVRGVVDRDDQRKRRHVPCGLEHLDLVNECRRRRLPTATAELAYLKRRDFAVAAWVRLRRGFLYDDRKPRPPLRKVVAGILAFVEHHGTGEM